MEPSSQTAMLPNTRFDDLRAFLEKVDQVGELKTVLGADVRADIGRITEILAWSPEHPIGLKGKQLIKWWKGRLDAADTYRPVLRWLVSDQRDA